MAFRPGKFVVEKVSYDVQPLYRYDLQGMVVSRHDSNTWWDTIHKAWNDHLNVADLCVVWGNNVRSGAYRDIEFSSGQFVCNFQSSSSEAYAVEDFESCVAAAAHGASCSGSASPWSSPA